MIKNRKSFAGKPLPFNPVLTEKTYYQVTVGAYGVVLPDTLNIDTLDGLKLIDGKASVIEDSNLATKIAIKTSGKLLVVTETYKREIEQVEYEEGDSSNELFR